MSNNVRYSFSHNFDKMLTRRFVTSFLFCSFFLVMQAQIITRIDVGISVLPSSVFERFIIHVIGDATFCEPWKTGFFVREQDCRILCHVKDGQNCSSVTLHGRFAKECAMDMWRKLLRMWEVRTRIQQPNLFAKYI